MPVIRSGNGYRVDILVRIQLAQILVSLRLASGGILYHLGAALSLGRIHVAQRGDCGQRLLEIFANVVFPAGAYAHDGHVHFIVCTQRL
jgi:hypothetical protein